MKHVILDKLRTFGRSAVLQSLQNGMVMLIPILMIGSFSLIFSNLPIPALQGFMQTFLDGVLADVLQWLYDATFGLLSLYMLVTISLCFARRSNGQVPVYGAVLASMGSFAVISGIFSDVPIANALGVNGLFVAIFCALAASALYKAFARSEWMTSYMLSRGSNELFYQSMRAMLPIFLTILTFVGGNWILLKIFQISSLQQGITALVITLFNKVGASLLGGLLYVFVASFLWMLGFHGSNMLEEMMQTVFVAPIAVNVEAFAAGRQATEIMSKTFLDVFAMLGGCGSALCLLVALLVFARHKSSQQLARLSALPALFNINEMLLFGLPVVLNPIFFIPFLITPIVLTLISYGAIAVGLVPVPITQVQWTTPILISGFLATGSFAGVILQLVNIAIGVLIYWPFIRLFEQETAYNVQQTTHEMEDLVRQSETSTTPIRLLMEQSTCGPVAQMLIADLKYAVERGQMTLFYQPQYDDRDVCIGAEALMRWEHPLCGMLYPPLVIQLAQESGILGRLECMIVRSVVHDIRAMELGIGKPVPQISVNLSSNTLQTEEFITFLDELMRKYPTRPGSWAIEVTEQTAFNIDPRIHQKMQHIKKYGISLIIDDFSMGHTSLKYLQSELFDMVKLDGALVREMQTNPRCEEIVASIVRLSHSLNFSVLAEQIETVEQRDRLKQIGCCQYQGYLYSPAIPRQKLMERLKQMPAPKAIAPEATTGPR